MAIYLEDSSRIFLLICLSYPHLLTIFLKHLQKKLSLNQISELSGHSFRVGAALDPLDKIIPLEKIMLRGAWKSETSAMRYFQSCNDSNWLIIN
ncbi:hypothetical protein OAO13_03545 [Candidatus Pseudothioglobus singularis]|nr:hypothetical protein [Candidatus Pseudothioglobus singularis]